jgi:hypothetical protein
LGNDGELVGLGYLATAFDFGDDWLDLIIRGAGTPKHTRKLALIGNTKGGDNPLKVTYLPILYAFLKSDL